MEFASGLLARELPLDGDFATVDAAVPGTSLLAQRGKAGDSSFAQAWAGEEANLDLCLI